MNKSLNESAKKFSKEREEYIYLFDTKGKVLVTPDGELYKEEKDAVAKLIEIIERDDNGELKQTGVYYLRYGRGDLYDPEGPYDLRRSNLHLYPFEKTQKEVFDLYIEYLQRRKGVLLTKARREFFNKGHA